MKIVSEMTLTINKKDMPKHSVTLIKCLKMLKEYMKRIFINGSSTVDEC